MKNSYGSFTDSLLVQRHSNEPAFFYGLEADVELLPTEGLVSGSKAFCVDTGSIYIYLAATKKWYAQ